MVRSLQFAILVKTCKDDYKKHELVMACNTNVSDAYMGRTLLLVTSLSENVYICLIETRGEGL